MDAYHHHRRPPIAGDPAAPSQQSPFWYPSSSPPPPPPGGYHHHLSPRAAAPLPQSYPHHHPPNYPTPPPHPQWDHPGGDSHHYNPHHHQFQQHQPPPPPMPAHPPHPPAPTYLNHSPVPPYSAAALPPLRYPPPPRPHNAPPYPPPNQAWGNLSWDQHQGWENPDRNNPYINEDDWAARARAWATAKPTTDYHHTPSFTSIGRTDEHNYAYNDQYQQVVGTPTETEHRLFSQSSNQQLPDFRKQDNLHELTSFSSVSSYGTDGHVNNAGLKALTSNTAHISSPRKSYGPSSSVYEQEVPYIYSSNPGNREAVDHHGSSHIPLPPPVTSVQGLPHSQAMLSVEQSHFTHGGQSSKPLVDPSDLPLDFEPRSASGQEAHKQVSYGHADPSGFIGGIDGDAIATSIHAWNSTSASAVGFSQVPLASSGTQFDTSYVSQPSLPMHTAPPFGMIPGSNFQSTIPPVSAPFRLAAGTPVHHALAFPGDGNGTFSLSERPKKAAVPNWLREEIIKKKPVISSTVPTHLTKSSFHSVRSEDADKSYRIASQTDSKSLDSTKSTEDEEDDEDDVEAARSAAMNQEIKRILTEVLLKVTDELFDEIATKVLSEDDLSVEVDESAVIGNHKLSPTPPAVPTPKASAKVLVQVKKNGIADDASDISSRSSPGGNVLGLANYASDDDDETESSTLLPSGMVLDASHHQERNDRRPGNKEVEPSHDQHNIESERNKLEANEPRSSSTKSKDGTVMSGKASRSTDNLNYHGKAPKEVSGHPEDLISIDIRKFNEVPVQNAIVSKPKSKRLESTSGTANNSRPITEEFSDVQSKTNKNTSSYPVKSNSRDFIKEVNTGKGRAEHKTSDASDSTIHEDRNAQKKRIDKRDYLKEKFEDGGVKKGAHERGSDSRSSSKHNNIKDDRKELTKDKREKDKRDGERKREQTREGIEDRSTRAMKDSFKFSSTRSSSPSNRGRKSKENSSGGHGSASGDEPSENSKKRKLPFDRRNSSPSPTRSTKRQVSRSPHSKHSHRRHSPYSSMERRRRSRSRTPVRHRSNKHDK